MTDLGDSRLWSVIPDIVRECKLECHETVEARVSDKGTMIACLKCGYFYMTDESD
jgi:hypothetical protein